MTKPLPPPGGFRVGHWTDTDSRTGCTVVIAPPVARGGVDVRGGGTGTRELEALSPLANAEGPSAVLLTGGSAFGLAAADGVARWLEERGLGRPTPAGVVPLVCAAVVFDLAEGDPGARPGPEQGYAACESASADVPERGAPAPAPAPAAARPSASCSGAIAPPGGIGYATSVLANGDVVAAIAVANAFGDVIVADGGLLGAPRGTDGEPVRTAERVAQMAEPPELSQVPPRTVGNTTLACVMTDASLDKRGCAIVARMASAGVARAVDPAFTSLDGDVVFCLGSGSRQPPSPGLAATWSLTVLGTVAASVTAAAIRDAVLEARRGR